jgi:phage host-nuclease inhibitor protein Gam
MSENVVSLETKRLPGQKRPWEDGLPYERGRYVQLGKFHLQQGISHFFEFGKCMLAIKENESWTTLSNIVEEEFGMSERSARRYMRFALVAASFPRFKDFFTQNRLMYKGLALLEGVKDPENDPYLEQFEATGEWGDLTAADLLEKSVRDLKSENRRLRREKEQAVASAVAALSAENESLRRELEKYEALQEQREAARGAKKLLEAGGKLLSQARQVYARVDWRLVLRDPALTAVARLQMEMADRIGGDIQTELYGRDDQEE